MAEPAPINWRNAITLISVAVLVGTEFIGAGAAAGWAVGGLMQLGDLLTRALQALCVAVMIYALYRFLRAALSHEPIRG